MLELKKWVRNGEGGVGQAVSVGKLALVEQEYLATWREWKLGLELQRIIARTHPRGGSEFLEEAEETAHSSKAPWVDLGCTNH